MSSGVREAALRAGGAVEGHEDAADLPIDLRDLDRLVPVVGMAVRDVVVLVAHDSVPITIWSIPASISSSVQPFFFRRHLKKK